jgi:D-glycero-D-manno-heptose 1,7-bisphosphate phosphatase
MAQNGRERRAVFLDRDGVVVSDAPHDAPLRHLAALPGVAPAIRRLRSDGWLVVVVTNQPAVARGFLTEADVADQHAVLDRELGAQGAGIDAFYFCPHHPNATVEAYRAECPCRKPRPGMLLLARDDLGIDLGASVMVGDRLTDLEAGARAGVGRTILVENESTASPRIATPDAPVTVNPDHRVRDLAQAAGLIVPAAAPAP